MKPGLFQLVARSLMAALALAAVAYANPCNQEQCGCEELAPGPGWRVCSWTCACAGSSYTRECVFCRHINL